MAEGETELDLDERADLAKAKKRLKKILLDRWAGKGMLGFGDLFPKEIWA